MTKLGHAMDLLGRLFWSSKEKHNVAEKNAKENT